MLFFRRKSGFTSRRNIFQRLYNSISGWVPLVAVFSLGIFGTHVYYKNAQLVLANEMKQQHTSNVETTSLTSIQDQEKIEALNEKVLDLQKLLDQSLEEAKQDRIELTESTSLKTKETENQYSVLKEQNQKLEEQLNDNLEQLKKNKQDATALEQRNYKEIETLKDKISSNENTLVTLTTENTDLKSQLEATQSKLKLIEENQLAKSEAPKSRNLEETIAETSSNEDLKIEKVSLSSDTPESKNNRNKKEITPDISENITENTDKEVRVMKLKKGESLWNLSKRAYGKGSYYKNILNENPDITEKNFKRLQPGANILVPSLK